MNEKRCPFCDYSQPGEDDVIRHIVHKHLSHRVPSGNIMPDTKRYTCPCGTGTSSSVIMFDHLKSMGFREHLLAGILGARKEWEDDNG